MNKLLKIVTIVLLVTTVFFTAKQLFAIETVLELDYGWGVRKVAVTSFADIFEKKRSELFLERNSANVWQRYCTFTVYDEAGKKVKEIILFKKYH